MQILVGGGEIFLGLWLLAGWRRGWAWLTALATFVTFATVAAYLGWIGVASCGCFGRVQTNPWTAFLLDAAFVLALLAFGPPNPGAVRAGEERDGLLAPVPSILIVGAVPFLGAVVWAVLAYGSLHLALARLKGEAVTVDEPYLDLGVTRAGTTVEGVAVLRNWSSRPVQIVGTSQSCSCSVDLAMPATVAPGGSLAIPIRFAVPRTGGVFAHPVHIWTDSEAGFTVRFEVGGIVEDRGSSEP